MLKQPVSVPDARITLKSFQGAVQRGWVLFCSALAALVALFVVRRTSVPSPEPKVARMDRHDGPLYRTQEIRAQLATHGKDVVNDPRFAESVTHSLMRKSQELEFLTKAIRSASDAIVFADPAGRVIMRNPAAEKLFGPQSSGPDQHGIEYGIDSLINCVRPGPGHISRLFLEQKSVENIALDLERSDQSIVPCLLSLDFIKDWNGKNIGTVAVIKDNTRQQQVLDERAALIAELEHAKKEVEVKNAELERLSLTDGLTKLRNRRFFDSKIVEAYQQLHRGEEPLTLLMIDIDHFKECNDKHGHLVGDRVLRDVAQAIEVTVRNMLRKEDAVFRYGGEEIAVLLSKTDVADAKKVAERIHHAVASLVFKDAKTGKTFSVTVSIGVGSHRLVDIQASRTLGQNIAMLMKLADDAMYEAKRGGRNQTVVLVA